MKELELNKLKNIQDLLDLLLPGEAFEKFKKELLVEVEMYILRDNPDSDVPMPDFKTFREVLKKFIEVLLYVNEKVSFIPEGIDIRPLDEGRFDFEHHAMDQYHFLMCIGNEVAYYIHSEISTDNANEGSEDSDSMKYLDPLVEFLKKLEALI